MKKVTALAPVALIAIAAACSTTADPSSGPTVSRTGATSAAAAGARVNHGVYWKRGAKPLDPTTPPSTKACANPGLQYGGAGQGDGPVISNVEVVQVNWGANVDPSITALFESWYPAVVASPYLSWLSEYDTTGGGTNQKIGTGTYKKNPNSTGAFTITPTNQGTTLDQTAIGAEIVAQIKAGNLPMPTKDAAGNNNTIYMIDFPPGMTEQLNLGGQVSTSCSEFCGYHETSVDGTLGNVYFGVHPDMGKGSGCEPQLDPNTNKLNWACGGDVDEKIGSAVVHGHELVEAITDPQDNTAWIDPVCGEIGDICANELGPPCNDGTCRSPSVGSLTIGGTTYYMQTEWSNKQKDCVVQGVCATNTDCSTTSPGTPICDTTSHHCRACTNADCSGASPACETTGTLAGQCVACTSANPASCTGAKPLCDKTTDTCRGCTAADCTGATPVCEMGGNKTGTCVQCDATNSQACASNEMCNTSTNTCVAKSGGNDAGAPDASSSDDSGISGGDDSGSGNGSSSNGSTTTTSGCAVSSAGANASGFGSIAGLLFAATVLARRRARK